MLQTLISRGSMKPMSPNVIGWTKPAQVISNHVIDAWWMIGKSHRAVSNCGALEPGKIAAKLFHITKWIFAKHTIDSNTEWRFRVWRVLSKSFGAAIRRRDENTSRILYWLPQRCRYPRKNVFPGENEIYEKMQITICWVAGSALAG